MPFGGNRKKSFRVSEKNVWRGKKRNRQDKAEKDREYSCSGWPSVRSHGACAGVKPEGGFRGQYYPGIKTKKRKPAIPVIPTLTASKTRSLPIEQNEQAPIYTMQNCRKTAKTTEIQRGRACPPPVETCRSCRKNTYKNRQNCGLSGFSCKRGELKCNKRQSLSGKSTA